MFVYATMMFRSPLIKTLITTVVVTVFMSVSALAVQDSLTRKRRAQEAFINGLALQMRPDMQAEAILEFQQALRYDTSAVILNAIARSYASLDKKGLALEFVAQAIELDSSLSDAWELKSEILVDLGKYDEAVASYEHIRALQPTKQQLYTLGRLYEPRSASKAIDVFEELLRIEPDVSVYVRIADLQRRLRNAEGRADALAKAYALNPRDADLAAELVDVFLETGRIADAHALMQDWKSTERSAQIWAAALNRVMSDSLLLALYQDSVHMMLVELERLPTKPWQLAVLGGFVALKIEDTLLADKFMESALLQPRPPERGNPVVTSPQMTHPEQYLQVATAYLAFRRVSPAYDVLLRGLHKHPDDTRIILMLGAAAQQLDKVDDAIRWFTTVIERDSTIDDAWMYLGMIYDGLGDTERSESAYEQALSLNPDNHLVNNNFAYSLAVRGKNLQQAREMAWQALNAMPTNASYLDTFAWVLYHLSEFEKAKTYIERAIVYGGNATHYEHLGDILEQLGDLDGALAAWRKALMLDPSRDAVQNKLVKYR